MKHIKKHLFICTSCTYSKADGSESSPEEAATLRRNLKNKIRESDLKDSVRVSSVTCLGECQSGIAGVLYPQSEWFLGLRPEDESKLLDIISKD